MAAQHAYGHWENDGRVMLGRYAVECLKIPQLKYEQIRNYLMTFHGYS